MNSDTLSCVTCRLQKTACNGVKPQCGRCRVSRFECMWPEEAPADRARRACLPCRRRKIRCTGPSLGGDDDSACARCERLSLVCNWTIDRRGTVRGQGAKHSSSSALGLSALDISGGRGEALIEAASSLPHPASTLLNDKVEIQQVLRTYFGTVHYFGFLSFIHEPTLFRQLDNGTHPRDLTAVMVACTLRLAGQRSPDALVRADSLFNGVLQRVQTQIYEVYGAIELMTVVLLRQYQQMKGLYSSAWMLWGNAVKMMQFLSLHIYDEAYGQPHTTALNKLLSPEAMRRLAWAVFFMDAICDAGRHGVHTVTEEAYHIQLPCDETAFARGIEMRTESLKRPNDLEILSPTGQIASDLPVLGVSAHIIKTAVFRRRLLHFKSRIKYMTISADAMLQTLIPMESDLKALLAEIPPDLVYSEDNLYVHPERRTAYILLHALRHNCFIMLAETRIIICGKDSGLQDQNTIWMRDRIRHAYPVASIVSDALRLGIVCDPWVGALAYTCIEVLLFDTTRLSQSDPSIDPRSPELVKALKRLMDMIRSLSTVDDGMKHMRIEAGRRIIRRGLGDEILTPDDFQACQSDRHASGEDDAEFDFRLFRWHRLEVSGRIPNAARNPWAAEAILDVDARPISRAPSRRSSPKMTPLDAYAVSSVPLSDVSQEQGYSGVFGDSLLDPSFDGTDTLSYAEGTWSFEDNFARFMEQAGYATTVDPEHGLPWVPS